jgi:hypothetical protein
MERIELEFWFDGPHATADAQALLDFLKSELSESQKWQARIIKPPKTRQGESVELLLLSLALLGGVKNALDLADRLIKWVKEFHARHQRSPHVVGSDGDPVSLDQAKPEDLANVLEGKPPEAKDNSE